MPSPRRRVPAPVRARASLVTLMACLVIPLAITLPGGDRGSGASTPALGLAGASPAATVAGSSRSGQPAPAPGPAWPATFPPTPAAPSPVDAAGGGVAGIVSGPAAHGIRRPSLDPDDERAIADPRHGPDPAFLTGYEWPIPRGRITRPFGPARGGSFLVDGRPFHNGLDLATFCGDRVLAAHDGVVLAAGRRYDQWLGWRGDLAGFTARLDNGGLWGLLPIVVVIDDGNGYRSVYGHLSRATVKAGQHVQAGQLIGYEGRTGRASGCHLHYELFSPWETDSLLLDPAVARARRLPASQVARIDPELVLPPRPIPSPSAPSPSPVPDLAPERTQAPAATQIAAAGDG